ncbi:MAG: retron Ec78 anti-phage system effector HNH endonuclease PtuB [Pseudomonadota bacterium]
MHKLERPEAPGCLARYQDGPKDWRRVSAAEKQDIWVKLEAMQGLRCAYCEEQLYPKRRHIEHFRQRSDYPQETFQWDNLFGSCDKADSCGRHKDRQSYSYGDILKPDIDNPDDYLRFLSDGRIVPRKNLPADRLHRAEETLRVFNLDHEHGALRQKRYSALQGYLSVASELQEFADLDEDIFMEYLHDELKAIEGLPFETAIRHLLTVS